MALSRGDAAARVGDPVTALGEVWYVWATHPAGEVTLLRRDPVRRPAFVRLPTTSIGPAAVSPVPPDLAASQVDPGGLARRFWAQYTGAQAYDQAKVSVWAPRWMSQARRWRHTPPRSATAIGLILGTFSPIHNGHLALIDQAIRDLQLDHVYVIAWPFRRIRGFHPPGMRRWVRDQRHLGWSDRTNLLRLALADRPATVLTESREWYLESRRNYSPHDQLSVYWTGMWYVARKLQWFLNRSAGQPRSYVQICGGDQFNHHITRLLRPEAELPWSDYSVAHQLALQDVYVVPRDESRMPLERFSPPPGCPRRVTVGAATPFRRLSAAAVRFGLLDEGQQLEDVLPPPVVRQVRAQRWWTP